MRFSLTRRSFIVTLLSLALLPLAAHAAAASREEELRKSFEQRYPKLAELKKAGTVGETFHGYVELVDEKSKDKEAKEQVDAENDDRKELYKLIADKEKTTAEKVAERNAKRVFEKAKPGEYLKGEDGKWKKKE
jgi:uncharacterized protein YdbL (DUF1318 family)